MIEEKIEQGDSHSQKRSGNHMEYLSLDPAYIDTSVVTEIGIDKDLNSILIWVNGNLTMMTINLGDFAEKTIRPLKRNLSELLVGHKSKQSIINSVITTINRNIEIIKQLCGPPKDAINNNSIDGNVGCDAKPDTQLLVELTSHKENPQLFFKNQYGEAYVAVRLGKDKNLEIMSLGSSRYGYYLTRLFQENTGRIVGKEAVNNAINALAANALFDGETIPLHLRIAWGSPMNRCNPDCIYYDMADEQRRIIEVSKDCWRIINGSDSNAPILFKKHNQTPQVEPDRNYPTDIFDRFLDITNLSRQKHRDLLKVLIVSSFIPEIDHPILTTYGPQGAAKSMLLRLIKMLIDPSKPELLTLLKNIPEFIQQVNHNYLAFYDNVKFIPYWLSDEICKSVTGVGHTKRELYSDDNDIIYEHRRIISINGINVALTEPDALDRSIFIELCNIDDVTRKEKAELLAEFEKLKPKVLAYILDIVVKALQIKPTLKITRLPRMADFAKWGEAISRAMGYEDFAFLDAYAENRNQQNVVAVEENFIGSIFVRFYQDYEIRNRANPTFVGSPDLLYISIIDFAETNQININNRQFPKAPNILVKKLKSLQLNLREAFGITLDIERDNSNNSVLTIYRKKPSINHPNRYYEIMIQNRHLQNQNYISSQTPRNNEVTSGASMPPIEIAPSNGIGGSEVPEVTYVTSGVADAKKGQDIVKSDVVTRDKLTHAGDNETEEPYAGGFKN